MPRIVSFKLFFFYVAFQLNDYEEVKFVRTGWSELRARERCLAALV